MERLVRSKTVRSKTRNFVLKIMNFAGPRNIAVEGRRRAPFTLLQIRRERNALHGSAVRCDFNRRILISYSRILIRTIRNLDFLLKKG